MSTQISERLKLAEGLAKRGHTLAKRLQGNVSVRLKETKGDASSFVTEADLAVERFVIRAIRREFPEDEIFAEENASEVSGRGFVWVIDPIDGTMNYAHGLSPWAVSIAVLERGRPVVAAVAVDGVVYSTSKVTVGVRRNGERLPPIPRVPANKALVGFDSVNWMRGGFDKLLPAVWSNAQSVITVGSAVAACVFVLDGRLAAYLHPGLAPWDHAAVSLLLKKAGGRLTRWDGSHAFPGIWQSAVREGRGYWQRVYRYDLIAAGPGHYRRLASLVGPYAGDMEKN